MRTWSLYILENLQGTLYTGITIDIQRRIRQHNGIEPGGGRFTRQGRPWRLLYCETIGDSLSQALKRERQVKRLPKAKKLVLAHSQLEQTALRG